MRSPRPPLTSSAATTRYWNWPPANTGRARLRATTATATTLRLRNYKESELRFLRDMRVDPDNSLCERLARVFKRKQRQAIVFRSFEYLGYVCDSIAAVNNMRLGGKDVFAESSSIFDRPMPAKAASAE